MSATRHTRAGGRWGAIAKVMILLGALRVARQLTNERESLGERLATLFGKQLGPQYTIRVSADGNAIAVAGGMNDGAAAALTAALDRAPGVKTVIFDSAGGWIREGRLVADVISQRGMATHVDVQCNSACTLAFLAGKERTLGPRGRLGFHQVRTLGRLADQQTLDLEETQVIYRNAGLPSNFVDRVMATPPEDIWYPTVTELLAAHAITRRTEWDGARAELTPQVRGGLEAGLRMLHVPDKAFDALLDCEVTELIQWWNTTDCAYLYDPATKSLEQHLKEQQACADRADSLEQKKKIDLDCMKRTLPNDWSIYKDVYTKQLAEMVDRKRPNSPTAQKVSACAVDQYVALLNHTGCVPMNLDASTPVEMFADHCREKLKPMLMKRRVEILRDCRAAAKRDRHPGG
jgi:hypothetical protein